MSGDSTPSRTISEVVRDSLGEQGLMMTGMVGLVTFMDIEGNQMFALVLGSEEQTAIMTQGLATTLDKMVDDLVRKNFELGSE